MQALGIKKKLILAVIALGVIFSVGAFEAPAQDHDAKVVFGVHCYDVGKAALEDQDGVISVSRGWRGLTEINTVYYDPSKISVEEMENILKKAGTYKKTFTTE